MSFEETQQVDAVLESQAQTIEARAQRRGDTAGVRFTHPHRSAVAFVNSNQAGQWQYTVPSALGLSQIWIPSRLEGIRWALREGFEEAIQLADLPADLGHLIRRLLARLPAKHELEPAERQAIYAALGPWERRGPGHRRRARLAIRSAKRVLPLVEQYLPVNMSAVLLLVAQQVLEGEQDASYIATLWFKQSQAWLDADPRAFQEWLGQADIYGSRGVAETLAMVEQVTFAAERALEVALFDECDVPPMLKKYPDTTPDYWSSDGAAWAWLAERGKDGPAAELRNADAFWEWWLTQAVPQAWVEEG